VEPTYQLVARAAALGNARYRPWYLYPRNGVEVVKRLSEAFAASSTYHTARLRDSAAAFWLYLADKYDGLQKRPQFLDKPEYVDWWGKDWYRTGPRSNLVKLRVDALTAWLFADPPRLEVKSLGAPFELRRAVEDRSLALDSTVNEIEALISLMETGRDGWLTGWGACLPVVRSDRMEYKRLLASQVWWDPTEGSSPWSMIICELRDRWDLCSWYEGLDRERLSLSQKNHRNKVGCIERASASSSDSLYGAEAYMTPHEWMLRMDGACNAGDQVLVVHAWRRSRTGDRDRADGRYVMAAAGPGMSDPVLLCDMPYLWADLPVCWWSPYPDPSGGITGVGISHVLKRHQKSLDHSDSVQQDHVDTLGWTKVAVDDYGASGEEASVQEFAEQQITLLRLRGLQTPVVMQVPAINESHLRWSREIERRADVDSGVPAVIQSGQTQRGAGAPAVAMVEEASLGTDRLSDAYRRWQRMRVRVGTRTLEEIEDALVLDHGFEVSFNGNDGRPYTRNWGDLHRLNERYSVGVETAGALGNTRQGRVLRALDLAAKGLLDPQIASALLTRSPDMRAGTEMQRAGVELVIDQLDELVKPDGAHEAAGAITKEQDLLAAVYFGRAYINLARQQQAEFSTIERLRTYFATAESLLAEQRQGEQGAGGMVTGGAMGEPLPAGVAGITPGA
jgi:hypothetical protein